MNRRRAMFAYLALFALCWPCTAQVAQSPTPEALLHEAIEVLSSRALGREQVDWKQLESELVESIRSKPEPEGAHEAIAKAVAKLNDPHARFTPPPKPQQSPPSVPAATPTQSTPARPQIPTKPEGRVLDDGVAYLVVPGCSSPDVAGLREYALAAAGELSRLSASHPKAWVIDLRLNGGGNLWPMLLGLQPLLGEGPLMTMVNDGKIESRFGVGPSSSWIDWGKGHEDQLTWPSPPPNTIAPFKGKIAVLIGPWTMSSGESLAICFSGCENVRTFGENTAGLTTVTNYFPLSDGSVLNLPVSRMGDKEGKEFRGPVEPVQVVPLGEWPKPDDDAARAARAWALQ